MAASNLLFGVLLVAASFASNADAAEVPYDEKTALAISQAAVGREISNHSLTDRTGQPLDLAELRGRPLIVSLIYTSCYHVCPMLTQHLEEVVEVAREALGEQSFNVLTVGFDTAVDTPPRMNLYAQERGIHLPGWYFASSDEATITRLASDLGFIYFASPKGFDHMAQTTVLSADGRVYAQVYGQDFEAPLLVEPLKQLVLGTQPESGTVHAWLGKVRLLCTIYDPTSGRYKFDYSIIVSLFVGLICLGSVAAFIVHAWRGSKPSGPAF